MATAPGSAHVRPGQPGKLNNQDAMAYRVFPRGFLAVLCDGCSAQPNSGIGADIGANLIAEGLLAHLAIESIKNLNWETFTSEIEERLRPLIRIFAGGDSVVHFIDAIMERFLFTAMILVVEDDRAIITALGDGVIVIDDESIVLDAPITSTPPYIGYRFFSENHPYRTPELVKHLQFTVIKELDLSSVNKSLVMGTDGLKELIEEDLHHPVLCDSKRLQMWLNSQTAEQIADGRFIAGKCGDDVSLVVVRTHEAQIILHEGRREIAELKRDINTLHNTMDKTREEWEKTKVERDEALRDIESLEFKLSNLATKAEMTTSLDSKMKELRVELERLRGQMPKSSSMLNRLLGIITRSDNNIPNIYEYRGGADSIWNKKIWDSDGDRNHSRTIYPKKR